MKIENETICSSEVIYSSEKKAVRIMTENSVIGYSGEVAVEIAKHLQTDENATIESIKSVARNFIIKKNE